MKKVFIQMQFGSPHEWTQQYIEQVQVLEKAGWYWKIFTPNKLESKGNVEIIPMTIEQYNDLVEQKLGVRPQLKIVNGKPNIHITDFYIFSGIVFEDYLKDADFWGITNLDVVFGRLDHFLEDEFLNSCDIFSDDVNTINGVFSLWRNTPVINNLFRDFDNWREMIMQLPCPGCADATEQHLLYANDEIGMTKTVRKLAELGLIKFKYPKYYPMLSHDRLQQHVPIPKLEIKPDGSLWELFTDMKRIDWEHERPVIGKEIMYFHFSRTKHWPIA